MKKNKKNKNTIIENVHPDFDFGLSNEQVLKRKDEGMTNSVPKKVTKSYFKIFFDNVFNFFNLLLVSIFIFMLTAEFDPSQYVFIYLLIINISIGLFQDIRARKQVDKLKVLSDPNVNVLRNGEIVTIKSNEVVLSDIVVYKTGNQIIADSILRDGHLEVNESLITGESTNIIKNVGDKLYSGSFVTSGNAKAEVSKVGKSSYAETLQLKAKEFKRPKSEILKTINKLFKLIFIVVLTLGTAVVVTYLVNGKFNNNYVQAVRTFSGSMVAMIPTGMFLLVSLTLAVGVIRLAKKRMLVQELYCIESLARIDTLCLDKTGTLTDGTMKINTINVLNNISLKEVEDILLTLVNATKDENSTALAIKNSLANSEIFDFSSSTPFNSERKYSSVSLIDGRTFILGAREFLPHDNVIDKQCEKYEKEGLRVLILCLSKQVIVENDSLPNLENVAIVVLEDHIKDDAIKNIEWFKNNGVNIKIISGDNPISVSKIAEKVSVENADKFISLEGKSIEEVKALANKYTVFGRVSPEQKEAIVKSLQSEKHIVAMTGDGVNDILALKAADCSIAMASGSEAARSIANLVTLDSNFSSLPDVVKEGRRVINNLQRTCSIFLIKTFFAMVLTLIFLIASWVDSSITYPFITKNMYIWELLTIGFTSFFLSLQPNDEQIKNTFFANIVQKSIPGAIVQLFFTLLLFVINFVSPEFLDYDTTKTLAVVSFTLISFITLVVISIPFDKYRLVLSIAIAILIGILFAIDYFVMKPSFFGINYSLINETNWWLLPIIILLAIPMYFCLDYLAKKIVNNFLIKKEKAK